jgi:hypothetical protein
MTKPDFLSRFFMTPCFLVFIPRENEKQAGSVGLKNKWFLNVKVVKKACLKRAWIYFPAKRVVGYPWFGMIGICYIGEYFLCGGNLQKFYFRIAQIPLTYGWNIDTIMYRQGMKADVYLA